MEAAKQWAAGDLLGLVELVLKVISMSGDCGRSGIGFFGRGGGGFDGLRGSAEIYDVAWFGGRLKGGG